MNVQNYMLEYWVAGVLGVLLHIFAVKIPSLANKAKVANHTFSFKDYLRNDWYAIIASFLGVFILIVCLDELLAIRPALAKYIKWLFVFVGFTGTSIILSLMSLTNKKIMAVIDIKTNQADGIVPPVTPQNVEGVEEIKKEEELNNTINQKTN